MFLLDTNVVSELRKAGAGRADKNVVAWATDKPAASMFVSAITVQELEIGVLLAERRDAPQGRSYAHGWTNTCCLPSASESFPVDTVVARRSAPLHVPDPRPVRDALIAATALVHGLTVVTRYLADFAPTGTKVIDPWDTPGPA
jgi:toxin FitB